MIQLFWALAVLVLDVEGNGSIQIVASGSYHGDEVVAENGEIWLGLFQRENGFFLEETLVSVRQVHDVVLDSDGEFTGKKVFSIPETPVLYLRDSSGSQIFTRGEIHPLVFQTEVIAAGDVIDLEEAGWLEASEDGLFYHYGDRSQRISSVYPNLHGEGLYLFMAGDLDGDGLCDLILNDCGHYNIFIHYRVFLSSPAGGNDLLQEVASFMAIGC